MTIFDACMGERKKVVYVFLYYNSTKISRQNFIFVCAQCRHSDKTTFRARAALYYHCLDEEEWVFGEKNANQLHSIPSQALNILLQLISCSALKRTFKDRKGCKKPLTKGNKLPSP